MKKIIVFLVSCICFTLQSQLLFGLIPAQAQSIPRYDPNYVMSDSTFSSTRAFPNAQSVQDYLQTQSGPLKDYRVNGKRASDIIWDAARGVTSVKFGVTPQINPGVLLAYLQKEMSLISIRNYDPYLDPQGRIAIAMGYGCPDTARCNPEYYGFENQVNWASFQLQHNFNRSEANLSSVAPYIKNNTFVTLDEYIVTPVNSATAANYRYTPHAYWGNYNLWKIITANGWGVSSQTYTLSEIDNANLPFKDAPLQILSRPYDTISRSEGLSLVKQNYTFGQKNQSIERLQAFLRQEGYYMIREINGMYGTKTPSIHKQYRIDKKIIDWSFSSASQTTCENLFRTTFSIGTQNSTILQLQKCLTDIGIFDANLQTSYYGPITDEARKAALSYMQNLQKDNTGGASEQQPQTSVTPITSTPVSRPSDQMLAGTLENPFTAYVAKTLSPVDCKLLMNRNFRIGKTGQSVFDLQTCLMRWGRMSVRSGYFGDVTEKAMVRGESEQNRFMCKDLLAQGYQIGNQNANVLELQNCLVRAGLFDPTLNTGYFGSYTLSKITEARAVASVNQSCWAEMTKYTFGDRNESIKTLQRCLIDMKFLESGNDTGYYGPLTRDGVTKARIFAQAIKID